MILSFQEFENFKEMLKKVKLVTFNFSLCYQVETLDINVKSLKHTLKNILDWKTTLHYSK